MKTKVGFIGFGLIAGSLAHALKESGRDYHITATSRHLEPVIAAVADGIVDVAAPAVDETFAQCDIILLCTPVITITEYLTKLKAIASPDCIITDVGSVKTIIHEAADSLGLNDRFIGGHPMAGSEKTGYENSTTELLENAFYILTPTSQTPQSMIDTMENIVSRIGAIPVVLQPDTHDDIVAAISHVPHIIAASLVNMVREHDDEKEHMHALAAGGFKDITRIASSSPVMWENICLTNPDSIIRFIDLYIQYMTDMKEAIQKKDSAFITSFFEHSKTYRDSIPTKPMGAIASTHDLHIDVTDKKGEIAIIATILASHDVSLKNIGISHNREDSSGVLCIEFYDETSLLKAEDVLHSYNYVTYSSHNKQ